MQPREHEIINDVKYNSFSKKKFSDNGTSIIFSIYKRAAREGGTSGAADTIQNNSIKSSFKELENPQFNHFWVVKSQQLSCVNVT